MALGCVFVALYFVAPLAAVPPPSPPPCSLACSWCERAVAPQLARISKRCPNCSCASLNNTCPAPHGKARFCLQGPARDDRHCSSRNCDFAPFRLQPLRQLVQDCPKTCPGGFQLDPSTGQPLCTCVCPLERLAPMERTQSCAQTCRGFTFSLLFNRASGCTECFCGQKLPVQNCLPFACPLYCPLGYDLGPNGCPLCRCKEPAVCPPALKCPKTCLVGPQRDPFTGCITSCKCADEEFHCPLVGCNQNCGPHKFETVVKGKCVLACKCTCNTPTCPEEDRFCIEPELDQFGCPTCNCKRYEDQEQRKLPICRSPDTDEQVLCDIKCPSGIRPFDQKANCELCACCPDVSTQCPDLQCEQYAVNRFGCPVCECQSAKQKPNPVRVEDLPDSMPEPQPSKELDIPEQEQPQQSTEDEVPLNIVPYHPMKPEVPNELFQEKGSTNHHPDTKLLLPLTFEGNAKDLPQEILPQKTEDSIQIRVPRSYPQTQQASDPSNPPFENPIIRGHR